MVYRVFSEDEFITDHVVGSVEQMNEYVDNHEKLYRKENDEYYLWFDGENWLFPKPSTFIHTEENPLEYTNLEILSVLQEINSKLDNLS